MKVHASWVALAVFAAAAPGVYAAATPADVPTDHWAYQAVEELANKGYVLGYPDGKFLGSRSLTRYEMATLIQRILHHMEEAMAAKPATVETPASPEPTPAVSADDVAEIRRLVDEYKVELSVIGTDMEKVKTDIAALQGMKEDVEAVKSTVEGHTDQINLMGADIASLQKLKVSGYIQSRYESGGGIYKAGARPDSKFYIRRGRVKFTYGGDKSTYVLQIDAAQQNAVELKDAYVTWNIGPTATDRQQTAVWFGQFNTPFGYEIERSSSEREFPERSFAERALFPGERDRGVRFVYALSPKTWMDASILNGGGVNESYKDDKNKDFTARVKTSITPWWDLGVSGYWGKKTTPAVAAVPGSLIYDKDTNGDTKIDTNDTPSFIKPKASVAGFTGNRKRYGVDTQMYILGGALRFEGFWGRQPNNAAVTDVPVFGWYGQYTYNLGTKDILGVRYDTYDPNRNGNSKNDQTSRWNTSWNHYVSSSLRLTASWEWFPKVPTGSLDKGLWTLQAQHKF